MKWSAFSKNGSNRLDWHVIRGALFGGAPALVVDLGGSHVTVTKEFLDLADIDTSVEQ